MKNEQNNLIPSGLLYQLQECEASVKSRSVWCKQHGVGYHKFNYWWKKWKLNSVSEFTGSSFFSVKIKPALTSGQIEIIYSDNVRVMLPADVNTTIIKSLLPVFSAQ